ncbi:SPRY domain-containing protein [Trichinella spiralis]|uniref:SPRY domain-containing protein n=1 Tax=Trichinella spiralis TaxID=6334 RepID=A0ABR3KVM8_TRISP
MKGVVVFPVVYADDGAIIDVSFSEFNCPPPDRYQPILLEQSLLCQHKIMITYKRSQFCSFKIQQLSIDQQQ